MKRFLTRRNIIIALVVVAIGVAVYLLVRKTPLPQGLIQVNGRIEGDVVVISSKYDGKIKELLAREGDNVQQGEMVVRLDDPETRDRLAQAQQGHNAVIAQSKAAGENVKLTSDTGSSVIEQAKGQVMQAKSSIEEAQAAVGTAAANVKSNQAAVSSAAVSVRQAAESISRFSSDVETARANLQSAQRTVEADRAQAAQSAANAQRFTNLARERVVTARQAEEYATIAARDQATLQAAIANATAASAQVTARESDLRRARDQVTAARADLERTQAQLAAARQDEQSAKARVLTAMGRKAQAEGILRQAQTAPTQVAISKSNRTGVQFQAGEAKSKVDEQNSILRSMYVTSPITGKVVNRIRDNGEVVTSGSPILEVVNLDRLYLKAYVPENQIGRIRLGLPAQVYVDSYPNEPFDATVEYISSSAEFTPKEVQTPDERVKLVYAVRLYFKQNPGHRLTPGMPADAIIRWKEGVPWRRPQY